MRPGAHCHHSALSRRAVDAAVLDQNVLLSRTDFVPVQQWAPVSIALCCQVLVALQLPAVQQVLRGLFWHPAPAVGQWAGTPVQVPIVHAGYQDTLPHAIQLENQSGLGRKSA